MIEATNKYLVKNKKLNKYLNKEFFKTNNEVNC